MGNAKSSAEAPNVERELRKKIQNCRSIDDFVLVYREPAFEDCLRRLERVLLHGRDREERARLWALDLSDEVDDEAHEAAQKIDNDRKIAKKFLMTLCDCRSVTEEDIVNRLRANKVKRIMRVCLVLDRAEAWYHLSNERTHTPGKPWYAKLHAETLEEWSHLRGSNGHTMNKRYLQLVEIEGLQLQADADLRALTMPARSPQSWADEEIVVDQGQDDEEHDAVPLIRPRPGTHRSIGGQTWDFLNLACPASVAGGLVVVTAAFFIYWRFEVRFGMCDYRATRTFIRYHNQS